MKNNKIFIACDSKSQKKINEIIKKTQNSKLKIGYKFGLEFLNSKQGRIFISKLKNHITFGDYKFSDIPNTCASAIKAVKKASNKTKLVGVTILTSLDNKSLKEIGFNKKVRHIVFQQAKLANKAKLDAIVCSAKEVSIVKKVFKKEIITPGIRFNNKINDQKRVLTPKQAFKNGSDWLVIGRPITNGNIKNNLDNLINHLSK